MELKHDSNGFLLGDRLSAEDITGRLDDIRDELRALRSDLSESRAGSGVKPPPSGALEGASSIAPTVSPQRSESGIKSEAHSSEVVIKIDRPAAPATPPDRREPGRYVYKSVETEKSAETQTSTLEERSRDSVQVLPVQIPQSAEPEATLQAPKADVAARTDTATPQRERDTNGRFTAPGKTVSPERALRSDLSESRAGSGRDANGRFVPAENAAASADSDDESSLLSRSIDGIGSKLSEAVQAVGSGTEEADPAVKAFNEVAQPLSRGFGKIMGDGSDRKQERWYRRFWMMMRGTRREGREEGKQQRRILKNIERKPVGGGGGPMLWRGIMLLLAPITGMLSLLGGLPIALAGAVIAGLKGLLTALGMGGIARRMTIPGSGRSAPQRGGGGQAGRTAARAGSAAARSAGQGGAQQRGGPSPSRGGRIAGALKAGGRRIPGIGALLGLGFMASDVVASERSDASREEKDATTGRAIGGGLGGIGGMAGGAAAGAALGSVVPVIGTAIGGIVGGLAGAYFGGNAGEAIGETVGGWVTDLRKSNLVSSLSQRWEYATTFMSSVWSQTSEGMAERWEYASTFASSLWSQASEGVAERWSATTEAVRGLWDSSTARFNSVWESLSGSLAERWASVTDDMKGVWGSAVSIAAEGWSTLTDAMGGVNDWIAEKTGIDIGQSTRDAGEWISGRATESAEWVAGHASESAEWVSGRAAQSAGWVADRAEVAADRIENATSWIGGRISEGTSWVGEKTGVTSAINTVRNAHNEASAMPALTQAMADAGITNPNEQAAFMGQMHHESGGFRTMEESFNYSSADRIMAVSRTARNQGPEAVEAAMAQGPEAIAELMYGGRMGNTEPGDGHRYRGRGFTQLTGRDNYTAASEALGIDLVNNPDMAADPEVAAKVATWYWQNRGGLSEAAQRGDTREVTRLINGGHNGLEDREAQTNRFLASAQAGEFSVTPRSEERAVESIASVQENTASPSIPTSSEPINASLTTPDGSGSDAALSQGSPGSIATVRTDHLSAMGLATRSPALGVSTPAPISIPSLRVPPVNEAPTVSVPLASSGERPNGQQSSRAPQDVSRDLGDRRIAHIVTGSYSGMG
ncbi:glycoside hydrolase family 19 protein [Vreelandella zhanjiangensis]|uniref:glycoside hydrolase family 19 protein n=1 Tax=Vreelandella zhanjiangensis TaxID=1121960 RepID=UPI00402A5EE8